MRGKLTSEVFVFLLPIHVDDRTADVAVLRAGVICHLCTSVNVCHTGRRLRLAVASIRNLSENKS